MARETRTVIRSDLSGEIVPDEEAVKITITFSSNVRPRLVLDASEQEVSDLIKRAHPRSGTRRRAARKAAS